METVQENGRFTLFSSKFPLIYIIFSMIKNKQNERKLIETRFFELLLKAETDQKHEERVQEQK